MIRPRDIYGVGTREDILHLVAQAGYKVIGFEVPKTSGRGDVITYFPKASDGNYKGPYVNSKDRGIPNEPRLILERIKK